MLLSTYSTRWSIRSPYAIRGALLQWRSASTRIQRQIIVPPSEGAAIRKCLGMLFAEDPSILSAEKILQELPKAEGLQWDSLQLAILLVTPKFAHLLHEDSSFLPSAMTSIFSAQQSDLSMFTSIVGVVDKLGGEIGISGSPAAREGIAYLFASPGDIGTEARDIAGDELSPSMLWLRPLPGPASNASSQTKTRYMAGVEGDSRIGIPMANTLFVNGRKTTLEETSWAKGNDGVLRREASTRLSSISIGLRHSLCRIDPLLPLKQLAPDRKTTPFRVITSALGNVLRTVEVDGVDTPASREIEEVVAKSPLPLRPDGSQAKVYAAVTPKDRPELSGFAPQHWNLMSGKSFFRVTGGGGGWGQKQGLLSLDPRRSYNSEDDTKSGPSFADTLSDEVPDFLGSAKSVVKAGDRIAFYTEGRTDVKPTSRMKWPAESREGQNLLLGVTRSLEGHDVGSSSSPDAQVDHLHDSFGILSDQGLAFEMDGTFFPPLEKFADAFSRMGDGTGLLDKTVRWHRARSNVGQPFSHKTLCELPGAWVGSVCWSSGQELTAQKAERFRAKKRLRLAQAADTAEAAVLKPAQPREKAPSRRGATKRRQAKTAQTQPNPRPAADRVVFHVDVPQPDEFPKGG